MRTTILFAMMLMLLMSCEKGHLSKSGQPVESTKVATLKTDGLEKVVIQDAVPEGSMSDGVFLYTYKVKRIEKGVMDYARDPGLFKVNDTILVNQLQFH